MIVNMIVSRNRISGGIRTGITLRLEHPPPGVTYRVIEDPIKLRPSSEDFYITGDTTLKWILKAIVEPVFSVGLNGLVHAFFLNLYIPHSPWVQEMDQPIFNLFEKYLNKPRNSILYDASLNVFRSLYNKNDVIMITWTKWSKNGLEEEGFRDVRVVPPPMVTNQRKLDDKITVGFVGVEYKRKGGDIAEKVMSKLPRYVRKVYVGKSPKRLSGIEYHEPMSRDKLLKLMAEFDILLFPTRGDAYGFTMLEAMSYGIPVIASNVDPTPEILGDAGIVCDIDDINCFLDNTKELVESPEYIMELGAKAKALIIRRHSPKIVGNELLSIYRELA